MRHLRRKHRTGPARSDALQQRVQDVRLPLLKRGEGLAPENPRIITSLWCRQCYGSRRVSELFTTPGAVRLSTTNHLFDESKKKALGLFKRCAGAKRLFKRPKIGDWGTLCWSRPGSPLPPSRGVRVPSAIRDATVVFSCGGVGGGGRRSS